MNGGQATAGATCPARRESFNDGERGTERKTGPYGTSPEFRLRLLVPPGTTDDSPPLQRWDELPSPPSPVRGERLGREIRSTKFTCRETGMPTSSFEFRISSFQLQPLSSLRDCAPSPSLVPPINRWAIFNRPYRDAEIPLWARFLHGGQFSPSLGIPA